MSRATKKCLDCGEPVTDKPNAKYCPQCRSKRLSAAKRSQGLGNRKYFFNERIDNALREIYATPHGQRNGGVAALARKLGWGKTSLTKRASELGIASQAKPSWSQGELRILELSAHLSVGQILRNLKRAGFHRTETAIIQQRRHSSLTLNATSYYSAAGLAECFGTTYRRVARWIHEGMLIARNQGTALAAYGRDLWLIHQNDVREFIRTHPTAFDIRTVDQVWFVDLVFKGDVALTATEAIREPETKQWDEDAEQYRARNQRKPFPERVGESKPSQR